ncbi:MAG TPA: lamin tail domain-containing protein [Verrucomicrobiae bacterium]|nr:lamin tail domain-containing protein [Verrucomicrobiae bacterium]
MEARLSRPASCDSSHKFIKLPCLLALHLLLALATRADLPPGWSDTDVGGPAISGSADAANGNWTVSGSGSDIWNNADQFHYAYTTVEGDGMITARITSVQNTDPSGWSKAGLMFRNDSTAGSANVTIVATWSQGVSFQWRSTAGGNSQNFGVPGINAPVWLRLARNGSTFTGYYSLNGSDWVQVTSRTVALNNSLLAGLDVTAHNNSALHTATFSDVSVLGSATNLPPQITGQPADALVAVGQNATFNVQLLVTAGATYQWYRGATNLPGATNASFSLSPVTPNDNGAQFYCAITNAHGSTNTRVATLTISTNGILRDVWLNIGGGNAVADLTNHAAFPDNPSFDAVLTDLFETPSNAYDQYGQRLRALITAPETGDYRFWIASDDGGQLFVSTDETPANRRLVASVSVWAGPREWNKYPEQQSAAVPLVAGQRYYIEALMKEGGGGDNLAVRWQLPSGGFESPIPASRCVPFGVGPPVISRQPTNLTVIEGGGAGFSVALARTFGATFQWKRNGANLLGDTNSSYALSSVALSDNGSTFSCAITNSYGWTNSAVATLTVLPDTSRPTILSAVNLGDSTRVTVLYSEPVEAASATNASNYALNLSATVSAAHFAGDNRTVILTTSPLNVGPTYTLTVNNVRDRATTPNTILPNSTAQFTLAVSPLDIRYIVGTNEPAGPSSRRTGVAITEIMYHPTNRADGRNLEFIELYNSNPWAEDLSGYRISGDADYTFPAGTSIPARSYRIVAARPTDMATVHGLSGVLGPLTNSTSGNTTDVLDNGGGTLRLRDELDSVLLEVEYDDESPWPVSPDGAGPSLVLARPSYGEADPHAWSASDRVGGSPGAADVPTGNPWRTVVINEVLAHTDPPLEDYVELFNYSTNAVNLGNCILTDDPESNRFVIAAGTTIPPLGKVAFTQTQLGFALDAAGETIYLKAPDGSRVVDALRFDAQENGVAYGRYPDGATTFRRLMQPTPGNANARPLLSDVVINELQYHPVTENDDEEFVEIYNRGTNAVNLAGWGLRGGIDFTFAAGTTLPAGGYAVVVRSRTNFFQAHPAVNPALVLGEFSGGLGNGGDVVRLTKPDDLVSLNQLGQPVTNKIHIAVDEVTYGTGGRWGNWADGGGSSLERMDPRGFGNFAPNWANSDETAKSGWTTVEFTGLLDHGGMANADQLQILLLGAGECLVDDVAVIPQGGGNIVVNGSFNGNANGWFLQGTHQDSAWQATGGYSGGCLRVVASDRGDTGANRIRTVLTQTLSPGTTATLRARVRWLKGHPELLLRLHGNYLEAAGPTLTTRALGSPGASNTRYVTNAGPAITSVSHWPVLPAAGAPVTVTAQIDDPDGLSAALLKYRLDPDTNFTSVALSYRGAGLYSATIPGQAAGAQVAFYLETSDGGAGIATTRFPANAPVQECLVRFGEPAGLPMLGTYRLWVSDRNVTRWSTREKQSNHPLDATFVYGDVRVCYNAGTLYSGSPWHTPGYSGPMGSACDYELNLAKDDLVLGANDFVLGTIGNLNSEGSLQAEQASFWILRKLGAPYLYRRHVRVFFNGQQRGNVYEDAQQPNRQVISQFFPNDDAGSFHKIEDWFEFDDSGDNKTGNTDATLENFTTTGGAKKTARYRWTWRPRGVRESANDFTNLFTLVNAANAPQPEPYRSQVAALVEVEEWMRILAGERIVGNWDSYGYNRGKNMYAYKPDNAPWQLLAWDIDFNFGTGDGPNSGLFGGNEPVINQLRAFPEFQRAYWRAFEDAVNGPLEATTFAGHVDPIYNGLVTAGVGPDAGTTQALKNYAAARRSYILGQLSGVAANFTVNGSTAFSTNRNFITITGTAPIGVATLTVNGVAAQPTWTSVTGWTLRIALQPGLNNLTIAGWNNQGQAVAGASVSLAVTFTGVLEPADRIVINELMYHPATPEAEFVEIVNTATNTAYDLSNWRLNGLDGTVLPGTILEPGAFLVFAKNAEEFWRVYGSAIPLAGTFSGSFDKGGETIQLVQPGTTPAQDVVIDQVTYDDDPPWPAGADGTGPSLQLVDPTRDNNRVANWLAVSPPPNVAMYTPGTTNSVRASLAAFPTLWLNELLTVNNATVSNAVADRFGEYEPWVELYNGGTNPISLANFYLTTNYNQPTLWPFAGGATIQPGEFKLVWLDGEPGESDATEWHTSFRPASGQGVLALTYVASGSTNVLDYLNYNVPSLGRSYGNYPDANVSGRRLFSVITPGATNNPASLPVQVYINEWMADNLSTRADPADGQYEDWFEIYNPGTTTVDLGGYYFTDNLANKFQFQVPENGQYVVPPQGYLLVWADNESGQNATNRADLHVSFALSKGGEAIGLFAADGTLVDAVTFGAQITDQSEGRLPDGSGTIAVLDQPSPGSPNSVPTNTAPVLDALVNRTVAEGTLLTFTATATDADLPPQTLTFSLEAGAPTGANISSSGVFSWIPTEAQGPGSYPITVRVTDNGAPPASAIQPFTVTVLEANQAPQLAALSDVSLLAGRTLNLTNTATDADLPAQTLTFQLMSAPAGMTIDPVDGRLTWRPLISQSGTTNSVTVRVVDNGPSSLADTKTFSAIVLKPAVPVLTSPNASNGWFSFGVTGDQGPDYVIERSTALTPGNWLPLFTNLSPLPPFTWSIFETNGTRNFYRARLAP